MLFIFSEQLLACWNEGQIKEAQACIETRKCYFLINASGLLVELESDQILCIAFSSIQVKKCYSENSIYFSKIKKKL